MGMAVYYIVLRSITSHYEVILCATRYYVVARGLTLYHDLPGPAAHIQFLLGRSCGPGAYPAHYQKRSQTRPRAQSLVTPFCRSPNVPPLLLGIVSWGYECGTYPGVYTRVASFVGAALYTPMLDFPPVYLSGLLCSLSVVCIHVSV